MANGIRTGDSRGFNKGRSSKFREGSRFRQHLKKAGGHIVRKVVEITINMKSPKNLNDKKLFSNKKKKMYIYIYIYI